MGIFYKSGIYSGLKFKNHYILNNFKMIKLFSFLVAITILVNVP